MPKPTKLSRRVRLFFVVGLVAAGSGPAATTRPTNDTPGRAVSIDALRVALASRPVTSGPLEEATRFFETRLDARPGDQLSALRLIRLKLLAFRAGNDVEELARVRGLLEELGQRVDSRSARTTLALAEHDFTAARDEVRRWVASAPPGDERATLALFDVLWASGDYAEAYELLESASFHVESAGVLSRRARVFDGLGDVEVASKLMARVVGLTDAYAEHAVVRAWARVEHGHFLAHSGRPHAAVGRYLEALGLVPGYPAALAGLAGVAYGVDHDLAGAQALLESSVEHGGHLDAYVTLSEIARGRGMPDRSRFFRDTFLERATEDERSARTSWRSLALVMADRNETLGEALRYAELDLAQRADRGAWATRGWVLGRLGRHAEAIADVRRALEWGAPEPDVLYRAGIVHLDAGYVRTGRGLLRQALDGATELGPLATAEIEAALLAND